MNWQLSDRFDPVTRPIADRHYNRQKPGTGSCRVIAPARSVISTQGFRHPVAAALTAATTRSSSDELAS